MVFSDVVFLLAAWFSYQQLLIEAFSDPYLMMEMFLLADVFLLTQFFLWTEALFSTS